MASAARWIVEVAIVVSGNECRRAGGGKVMCKVEVSVYSCD